MPHGQATTPSRTGAERPRLIGLAYRILGSRIDAEDIVQEAWLRYERADPATIDKPAAWLTTVVSRLALDQLRSARHRREAYVGPWLPEFVGSRSTPVRPTTRRPRDGAGRVAHPRVPPGPRDPRTVERVVFLLADVFDVPHAHIADGRPLARGRRQIACRARRRVRENGARRRAARRADAAVVESWPAG